MISYLAIIRLGIPISIILPIILVFPIHFGINSSQNINAVICVIQNSTVKTQSCLKDPWTIASCNYWNVTVEDDIGRLCNHQYSCDSFDLVCNNLFFNYPIQSTVPCFFNIESCGWIPELQQIKVKFICGIIFTIIISLVSLFSCGVTTFAYIKYRKDNMMY